MSCIIRMRPFAFFINSCYNEKEVELEEGYNILLECLLGLGWDSFYIVSSILFKSLVGNYLNLIMI